MEPGQRLWETWRAVMPAGPHSPPWDKLDADSQARWASVEAALTAIEAAGMRVVPVEPSEKMIAAAWGAWKERHKDRIGPGPGFVEAITAALTAIEASHGPFKRGDRVRKTKGSSWHGRVVGFYSTSLTPVGYAVESEREPGSVQIYPVSALEPAQEGSTSE